MSFGTVIAAAIFAGFVSAQFAGGLMTPAFSGGLYFLAAPFPLLLAGFAFHHPLAAVLAGLTGALRSIFCRALQARSAIFC